MSQAQYTIELRVLLVLSCAWGAVLFFRLSTDPWWRVRWGYEGFR